MFCFYKNKKTKKIKKASKILKTKNEFFVQKNLDKYFEI